MRSMTLSSAGTICARSIPLSNPPVTPPTVPPDPTHIPPPSFPHFQATSVSTHILPLPTLPYHHHPFFNIGNKTQPFSPRSKRHVTRAIKNGWAESTVKRYSSSIDEYIRFCDTEGVPGHLRFPADEFVLCAFAASSAGIHSRSTPRNRLSALKAWHIAHNVEWKGSPRLRYVLSGVHNLAPRGSRRPPCPPINATMLLQLVEHLDLNSPLDVVIAACATTAFWGQCCLGELLPSSSSILVTTPFPTRSDFKKSTRNDLSYTICLPRTKTHRHGQEVAFVDQQTAINPITLLKRHLFINNIPTNTHLFSYVSPHGPTPLTKPVFLRRCNEIWHRFGYPCTTGHCFRIGGTTELLIAGTPPDVVKAMGRWSSDSFLRYWRSLDDIALQYIRHLHTKKHRR